MKKYSIAKGNISFIKEILDREQINYKIEENGENYVLLSDITKKSFKNVLEEALCNRKQEETCSPIPFYGHRILGDKQLLNTLQEKNDTECFCITEEELYKLVGYAV